LLLPFGAVSLYLAGSLHLWCRSFTHMLLLLPQYMLSICYGCNYALLKL